MATQIHKMFVKFHRRHYIFILFVIIAVVFVRTTFKSSIKSAAMQATHQSEAKVNGRHENKQQTSNSSKIDEVPPIVLWWTNFIDPVGFKKTCGSHTCRFTGIHEYLNHAQTKAVLFYGSELEVGQMPLPRNPQHIWALFHEESPKNLPLLMYRPALEHFNLTATFSRHSDFPLTLQYLDSYERLIDTRYLLDVRQKNRLQREQNVAPVLYLQSICDTMSDRDAYVAELMESIRIDSYGQCLNNNKALPKSLSGDDYLRTLQTEELYRFIGRYKFVISYENSVCDDYITEKLWRPLMLGVVPIYFGSPSVQDWLPNNGSAVLIDQFQSPKYLAKHLSMLNSNDDLYNRMIEHKTRRKIANTYLLEQLKRRPYTTNTTIQEFECFVCRQIHEKSQHKNANRRKQSQDMCGKHMVYPKMQTQGKDRDFWQSIMEQGKCEAILFDDLLQRNEPFTYNVFKENLLDKYNRAECD